MPELAGQHFAEAGPADAPPLVLVHGTLGDQRSFAAMMEPLAAGGRRVIAGMRKIAMGIWPMRWPSPRASCAIIAGPSVPVAPGRFSTTTALA